VLAHGLVTIPSVRSSQDLADDRRDILEVYGAEVIKIEGPAGMILGRGSRLRRPMVAAHILQASTGTRDP
jgi:hypothetical protein